MNNALEELGQVYDLDLENDKEDTPIDKAIKSLLDHSNGVQLANLEDTQLEILIRLVLHNEQRMKNFPRIYKKNNRSMLAILNLTKSRNSNAFDKLTRMFCNEVHHIGNLEGNKESNAVKNE